MKLKAERKGNALSGMEVLGGATLYRNSVALYDLEVLVKLYGGELLFAVFGEYAEGKFVATTKPVPCFLEDTEQIGGELWSLCRCGIPNGVLKEAGGKAVSIEIKQPYLTNTGETKYRLITSGIKSFTVDESLADAEFEGIGEQAADALQNKISQNTADILNLDARLAESREKVNALLQPPDTSQADIVGRADVRIAADGRLKFIALKGTPGRNGTVMWGHDAPSPISTLQWEIKEKEETEHGGI